MPFGQFVAETDFGDVLQQARSEVTVNSISGVYDILGYTLLFVREGACFILYSL